MIACSGCGRENPDDFAFCPGCGAKLGGEPPPASAAHGLTEERKVIAVLFCDLVSYTAHSEASDHELIDALLQRYYALARGLVEGHGGVVEKFIGDAVLAVFGFPRAHDDDAERAVRCALKLAGAAGELTWPDGDPVQVRIGVNSGETYLHTGVDPASGETFLTGDAVNTAARLESAAPPGGIVVGALTQALTDRAIIYEELPPLTLKGKKEPVFAWLAHEPLARTGLRTTGAADTPFVGRERESGQLLASFEQASTSRRAHFVFLVGEPGIGKSRLVLEFAQALEASPELVTWRQGRCLPYGEGVTFAALSEILKAHAGILDSDDVATVEARLESVLPEGEDRTWLRQRLRPLLGLEAAPVTQEENFAAWTLALQHIAASGPTVLVLEDLHWAGEGMLAFVEHLAAQAPEAPLLIVATARPELLEQHRGVMTPPACVTLLTLSPLARRDITRLVSALLDERLAAAIRAAILERVGGNPLYAEEYTRLLLDSGLLLKTQGVLRLKEGGELPVPDNVQAVLQARLDTLPVEHKALLCDAAVFGERFWDGGVAALSGCSREQVDAIMVALTARQLVRPLASSTLAGETEYLFWHALARDVAYGELPLRSRVDLHARAARWLETASGSRADEIAEVLAHHFATAFDLACLTGDDQQAALLVDPALRFLATAGDRVIHLNVGAAEAYFARALSLAPGEHPARPQLRLSHATALRYLGRLQEAAVEFEEAATSLSRSNDRRGAALATTRLAGVHESFNENMVTLNEHALRLLDDDGPSTELVEVLHNTIYTMVAQGGAPSVISALIGRALQAAKDLGLPEPARVLATRGAFRVYRCGDPGGVEDHRRAMSAAEAQGLGEALTTLKHNFIDVVLVTEGTSAALQAAEDALDLARDRDMGSLENACLDAMAYLHYFGGEWELALSELAGREAQAEASHEVYELIALRAVNALLLAYRGETRKDDRFSRWLAKEAGKTDNTWLRVLGLVGAAAAQLDLGKASVSRDRMREVAASLPSDSGDDCSDVITDAVRIALAAGDADLAACLSGTLTLGLPRSAHAALSTSAMLAEADGQHNVAARRYEEAASSWHHFGVPFEEAQALLGQGRCLVALGRASEASVPLTAARAIFARLGAKPALAETHDWLMRAEPSAAK